MARYRWAWCRCPRCKHRHVDLIDAWRKAVKEPAVCCDACLLGRLCPAAREQYLRLREAAARDAEPMELSEKS